MPIYRIPLNAGQTLPQECAGRFLQYVEGPAPLELRKDGTDWGLFYVGTGTGQGDFKKFEVRNPNAYAVTVTIWADKEEYIDRRRNLIEAATELVPVGDVAAVFVAGSMLAGANLDLSGVAPAGYVRRKAVQVSNLDPGSNLLIQTAAGVTGLVVRPGETITQPVSGFLRIRNATGAAIAAAISEIWWMP